MALIPDATTFQKRLAALPLRTYQAGEVVFRARSKTGQLLILKNGVVAIVKEDVEIAKVGEPGAVFGELSALLDQPHTADVRAVEISQFYVADTALQTAGSLVFAAGYVGAVALVATRAVHHQATVGDVLLTLTLAALGARDHGHVDVVVGGAQRHFVLALSLAARELAHERGDLRA